MMARLHVGATLALLALALLLPGGAGAQTLADRWGAELEAEASQNTIESLQVGREGAKVVARISFRNPPRDLPGSFSTANPARLALDFPNTNSTLGKASQTVNEGGVSSAQVVAAGKRTRVVFNLSRALNHDVRLHDHQVIVTLSPGSTMEAATTAPVTSFAEQLRPSPLPASLRDVNFRRGKDGEGRVLVQLSEPGIGVDVRPEGSRLVVTFKRAALPSELRRRLDVMDFGTPVSAIETTTVGDSTRMVITPHGQWEHNAYQSDNQFVVEVRRVVEDPNRLVQGSRGGYQGQKLSLNFQDVDVRAVLQVIADFTNFNIITSDSVTGNVTLRLKDVPWDQALDIILQAKGLDKRKNGNVIWIAPRPEIAAREKAEMEERAALTELEPIRTESFQINYHKAKSVAEFLRNKEQSILSQRGSVVVDERTNKVFVADVGSRLEVLRKMIGEIDVPVRQVLIEARIVEAADTFSRNLGARLGGGTNFGGKSVGTTADGRSIPQFTLGGGLGQSAYVGGISSATPSLADTLNVNLPAANISGRSAGAMSFVLWNSKATRFLDLEISALEADGRGKVVSSPRVMTADQVEALIEQGVEIPYQQATSSGATSVSFRKANLALKVRPQITPDGKIAMSLDVSKDSPSTRVTTGTGVAIDTKHVKTEVLVENGGTVVIGGIFQQEKSDAVNKIPLLGDLPGVGVLFRSTERTDNKTELMVFITPRVITDAVAAR